MIGMKIGDFAVGTAAYTAEKPSAPSRQTAAVSVRLSGRDRADFDRRSVTYARAFRSCAEDAVERIDGEAERSEIVSTDSEAERADCEIELTSAANTEDSKTAKTLRDQIKSVSELLSRKGLSPSVTRQLEKIYSLLLKQEETDPNNVSKELKDEIDKLSDMVSKENNGKKSLADLFKEQRERFDKLYRNMSGTNYSIGNIKNKIRQGRKLTTYELQLLSAKDPSAYESYCKINSARRMFRCSLNGCRTRDEVIGMRLSNALSALASYKKAIREGGDGSDVVALNAAFENELRDFSRSSGYQSLPTAAECNRFDRDLAKARQYEREKRLEEQRERIRGKRYKKKTKKTPGDGKRTVAQVLADPTYKKVLASRAKRAYCGCGAELVSYRRMASTA